MSDLSGIVKYYDALTGCYVEIPVTVEVEEYIKRSYWREDMQNRRYYARVSNYDDYMPKQERVYTEKNAMANLMVDEFCKQRLREQVRGLKGTLKELVVMVYFNDMTLTRAAQELGVSISYASRLLKKAKLLLQEELQDIL